MKKYICMILVGIIITLLVISILFINALKAKDYKKSSQMENSTTSFNDEKNIISTDEDTEYVREDNSEVRTERLQREEVTTEHYSERNVKSASIE